MAPSNINKPYCEATHETDGVPAKATATKQPDHIAEKKANLQSLHRDPNHSPDAIANRASSGSRKGSGGRSGDTYGQTISSATASHGVGGQGKHTHSMGGAKDEAVSSGTKYPDGSTTLSSHVSVRELSRDTDTRIDR